MKQKKAILYIRVSTDEQAEKGHSLAHQDEMLRKYCLNNNIEIVAFFKEDYSAKTFERPEFKKLLDFIRKNKGAADLLMFLKWDRFSRNAPEAYMMISKLHKLGIEPQAIEQPLNFEIPEQKFLLALYLTAPEVDNDRRAMNISAGIRKAMKDGRYMGPAPYGYKRGRGIDNKPNIIPGESANLVIEAFETIATGLFCSEDARRIMNQKGLPLGRTRFWCMLRNPVYMGENICTCK
jgi:site-specific DNA recombinase